MELKKLTAIISCFAVFIFIFFIGIIFIFSRINGKDVSIYYEQGLYYYKKNDYQNAYYNFSKIFPFSPYFLNALYKQAKSAEAAQDFKTALRKYEILNKLIKNENVSPFILWRLSDKNYKNGSETAAKKYLTELRNEYKETEYGIASNYLLSKITKDKESKKEYLLDYIKYSPKGKFAKEALIDILSDSEIKTDYFQKIIISVCLYENGAYNRAISLLKEVPFNYSWIYLIKSLDKLNSFNNVIKVARQGFFIDNSNFDEDALLFAVKTYLKYVPFPKNSLDEIYKNTNDERLKAIALYLSLNYHSDIEASRRKITLYEKYPSSKFASSVLFDLFMENYKADRIVPALKYGKKYLAEYNNKNEIPAVYYFVSLLKKKMLDSAYKETLNRLITEYPDNYYTYRAYSTIIDKNFSNKRDLKISENKAYIPYPYKEDKKIKNFFENFANERDFESFEDFRIKDPLILSWIEYKKGNRAMSSVLARDYIKESAKKVETGSIAYKLSYPVYYSKEINHWTEKRNLNPYLILALTKEESHFNPDIRSAAGATGLMQIMPSTADMMSGGKQFDAEELKNESLNIMLGTKYFEYLMNEFAGNEALCILSYNSGPNAVKRWLKINESTSFDTMVENIPYNETKEYIKKVYTAYWNYLLTYEKIKI